MEQKIKAWYMVYVKLTCVVMGVRRGGAKGAFGTLRNWDWERQFSRKDEICSSISISRCNSSSSSGSGKPDSLFWCYALMSLQFTPVRSYACGGRWSNLRAVCSTVGLYCVTITWQQIFKD